MVNKQNMKYTSYWDWIILFYCVISSFLDGAKLHLPKGVYYYYYYYYIITLTSCVILQVQGCITPILHDFACKYTILLRVKLHFRSWCNNTHKKTDSGGGNNFTPFLSVVLHFNFQCATLLWLRYELSTKIQFCSLQPQESIAVLFTQSPRSLENNHTEQSTYNNMCARFVLFANYSFT